MKATNIGNKKGKGSMIAIILMTSFLSINAFGVGINPETQYHLFETGSHGRSTENLISDISEFIYEEKTAVLEEEEIKTEKWMMNINDDTWVNDVEEEISIEKWMTDLKDEVWCNTDTEEDMEIEEWMLDPSDWLN
jgi:hypothetical protein